MRQFGHGGGALIVAYSPRKPLSLFGAWGIRTTLRSAEVAMPKVKTHSGAKKRFKRTATGKFKFAHVFKRHLLTGRTKKRKRQARNGAYVPDAHHHQIEKLLPYKE
jgi:large subunit ribosomal protein L35